MPSMDRKRHHSSGVHEDIEWCTVVTHTTRAGVRALNGYVRLPEGHPWRDCRTTAEAHERLVDLASDRSRLLVGGAAEVTYGPDDGGWVGFDTLRTFDHWEGDKERCPLPVHWTEELVEAQVRLWAEIVNEAAGA